MTEAMAEHHFDTTLVAYERWGQPCSETFSRAALDGAALPPAAAVLDVCGGLGALAVPAAERGHHGRAIDISTGMIQRANERLKPYPGWSAEVMDAMELQYADNEFDAAFSVFGVVYFGPGTAKALAEMLRVVRPGGVLSLQLHHHRAEHWVVVSGTARITRGEETVLLSENQSTYIPLGVSHRLENPGRIPLQIIEVQSGAYLQEDDIVRLDDVYNRV